MPELPDLTIYREQLARRTTGSIYRGVKISHPFLLRSVSPQPAELEGGSVWSISLMGKRIVVSLEGGFHLVIHLMIAGRLKWEAEARPIPKQRGLARFDFESGSLLLTEAGSKRRASLTLVEGSEALALSDPGGLDVLDASLVEFSQRLTSENHTLKRSLTDPTLFSGIGNAYSDEILHRAKISPFKRSRQCTGDEISRLYESVRDTLDHWIDLLRRQWGDTFPTKVTAFHPKMAVHGKYREPCPVCGSLVQRIRYAENECNYCPTCQTEGRLLSGRALSKLLKEEWPTTAAALEERTRSRA